MVKGTAFHLVSPSFTPLSAWKYDIVCIARRCEAIRDVNCVVWDGRVEKGGTVSHGEASIIRRDSKEQEQQLEREERRARGRRSISKAKMNG